MPSLIYAPAVRVVIATRNEGIIDVSEDLVSGQMALNENEVSSFNFALTNQRRKYDGVFSPNDRISVQFKRLGPNFLQIMSGYLNEVPFFSVYPRTVHLAASCTLKRLLYRLWDSGSLAAMELLNQSAIEANAPVQTEQAADGTARNRIIRLLTEVAEWPKENVHVAEVPADWFAALQPLEAEVATILGISSNGVRNNLGGEAIVAGLSPLAYGNTTAPTPAGTALPPGAGTIPNGGSGKVTVNPALAQFEVSMEWGHKIRAIDGKPATWITPPGKEQESVGWWAGQKIIVANPKNNRSVICTVGPWGPDNAEFDIALSEHALRTVLQASPGDSLDARIGTPDMKPGPFDPALVVPGGLLPTVITSTISDWTIPAGANPRSHTDFAWYTPPGGGNGNGAVPENQLQEITSPNGSKWKLHPVAASSYNAMRDEALKAGVRLNLNSAYRSREQQAAIKTSAPKAAPGSSNHGWGMALDIEVGGRYNFSGQVYQWLAANAARFGWVNPPWARQGSDSAEAWHWEFWAGIKYVKTPHAALPRTAPAADPYYTPPAGAPPGSTAPEFATNSNGQLVDINHWHSPPDTESELLVGHRALMNDEPLYDFVGTVCKATMRSFMSAPNGDFIAWFPDYFGHFGTAGRMSLSEIEMQGDGFTITWSDSHIVTHQFVLGAVHSATNSQFPGGIVQAIRKVSTAGIVSVEFPQVLAALLNIGIEDARFKEWIDPTAVLRRYGARKDFQTISTIVGSQAEFWCACYFFMKKWAQQFSTRIYMTWMPELYPGMILEVPSQGVQMYVVGVNHSFDFQGGGFQTSAVVIAPSTMDGSGLPLPRGTADKGVTAGQAGGGVTPTGTPVGAS